MDGPLFNDGRYRELISMSLPVLEMSPTKSYAMCQASDKIVIAIMRLADVGLSQVPEEFSGVLLIVECIRTEYIDTCFWVLRLIRGCLEGP